MKAFRRGFSSIPSRVVTGLAVSEASIIIARIAQRQYPKVGLWQGPLARQEAVLLRFLSDERCSLYLTLLEMSPEVRKTLIATGIRPRRLGAGLFPYFARGTVVFDNSSNCERGEGIHEKGYADNGNCIVGVDPGYFRPAEVDTLLGDASKAKHQLGWVPQPLSLSL